ncbi:hypothetical protein GW17_00040606, partial [Ensete ventricosum]
MSTQLDLIRVRKVTCVDSGGGRRLVGLKRCLANRPEADRGRPILFSRACPCTKAELGRGLPDSTPPMIKLVSGGDGEFWVLEVQPLELANRSAFIPVVEGQSYAVCYGHRCFERSGRALHTTRADQHDLVSRGSTLCILGWLLVMWHHPVWSQTARARFAALYESEVSCHHTRI